VGFEDKLRLMSVLLDELRLVKELGIKGCREVAFCNGGHLLAAVNATTVSIYSTYTGENCGNLRGHNGKVGWAGLGWRALALGRKGGQSGGRGLLLQGAAAAGGCCCRGLLPGRGCGHAVAPPQIKTHRLAIRGRAGGLGARGPGGGRSASI
jgi:hypothetical protein